MKTERPTHNVSIHIDLAALLGTLQRLLQHTLDIAAFGLIAADNTTKEQKLELPGAFFHTMPAQNTSLDFETARKEFKQWVLTGAVRDSIEAVKIFLNNVLPVCLVYSIATQKITVGDWNKRVMADTKKFRHLGLPSKMKYLEEEYDPSLIPEIKAELLSINLARNCLVHRNGIVADYDSNSTGGLLVSWQKMNIIVTGPNGERTSGVGERIEAGESISLRYAKAEKLFKKGESVAFTVDELSELCMTLLFFGMQLNKNLEQYGRSKGIQFNTPQDSMAEQAKS